MGALTPLMAVLVFGSTFGFFWVLYTMGTHSTDFLRSVDAATTGGKATFGACASLFAGLMYLVFYPEGERAADASASYGAGKVSAAAKNLKKLDEKWT